MRNFQRIVPIYRGTERSSGKQLRKLVEQVLQQEIDGLEEFLPQKELEEYHLLGYRDAHCHRHSEQAPAASSIPVWDKPPAPARESLSRFPYRPPASP